jgi:hypothetical protein
VVEYEALLRRTYTAFNARDVDAVVATMHPAVDWPNALEGGRLSGQAEVRDYWTRQFAAIVPHVEPSGFDTDLDGRIVVNVEQVVSDLDGTVLFSGQVLHVYTLQDGLIRRMDVREAPPSPGRPSAAAREDGDAGP